MLITTHTGVASSQANETYYVKVANYGAAAEDVTVKVPGVALALSAALTVLSGDELVANYPGMVSVTPQSSSVAGSAADGYAFSLPAWGVAVLAISRYVVEREKKTSSFARILESTTDSFVCFFVQQLDG